MKGAEYWIERLALKEHPEGGYYRETYRSSTEIRECCLGEPFGGPRAASTAIYFLLRGTEFSALHRIKSDEVWHHYAGASLTVHVIDPQGAHREVALGPDPDRGEAPQAVVPAGCWFGAAVDVPSSYSLVGCTVAPGFDFRDLELGDREELLLLYPEHEEVIVRLTRG